MPSPQPTSRRTQGERSARTRRRIVDATIECLLQLGYAGTSTPEVCRRAGLSRGALLHHFPSKVPLVTTALTHLARTRMAALRRVTHSIPRECSPEQALDTFFELLWQAYTGPLFHAALELWVAARHDRELHNALFPAERQQAKALYELWHILPDQVIPKQGAAREQFDNVLALTLHLLRGMAVQRILRCDDGERLHLYTAWKGIALREMAAVRALSQTP